MKLKVQDAEYTMPKILMKTSFRGRMFSIRFERVGDYNSSFPWGHLNLRQARLLVKTLERYISSEELNRLRDNAVSKALSKLRKKLRKEKSNA